MSMQLTQTLPLSAPTAPKAAALLTRLSNAVMAAGAARAATEMRRLAGGYELTNPALAQQLRTAADQAVAR